jgi:hypothetical protein
LLQVELRSEVIEAFPEAELIGLPEELGKWLCVPTCAILLTIWLHARAPE